MDISRAGAGSAWFALGADSVGWHPLHRPAKNKQRLAWSDIAELTAQSRPGPPPRLSPIRLSRLRSGAISSWPRATMPSPPRLGAGGGAEGAAGGIADPRSAATESSQGNASTEAAMCDRVSPHAGQSPALPSRLAAPAPRREGDRRAEESKPVPGPSEGQHHGEVAPIAADAHGRHDIADQFASPCPLGW